jgi:hypothetical protein
MTRRGSRRSYPSQQEYIQNLRPNSWLPSAGEKCVICQYEYELADEDIVETEPCQHLHHRECLLGWFNNIHDNRDTCPYCRTKLFNPDSLTPAQLAQQRVEEEAHNFHMSQDLIDPEVLDILSRFDVEGYIGLIGRVDEYFDLAHAGHEEYVNIPRLVVAEWTSENLDRWLCHDHAVAGHLWIRVEVSVRVIERMEEESLTDSEEYRSIIADIDLFDDQIDTALEEALEDEGDGDDAEEEGEDTSGEDTSGEEMDYEDASNTPPVHSAIPRNVFAYRD